MERKREWEREIKELKSKLHEKTTEKEVCINKPNKSLFVLNISKKPGKRKC